MDNTENSPINEPETSAIISWNDRKTRTKVCESRTYSEMDDTSTFQSQYDSQAEEQRSHM